MANMPINCFPRNVTLKRTEGGYLLLGEIDKHDVVNDVYLNFYNDYGNIVAQHRNSDKKFSFFNSTYGELNDSLVGWNTNPPYNFNSSQIISKIYEGEYIAEDTELEFSLDTTKDGFELSAKGAGYTLKGYMKLPLSRILISDGDSDEFIEAGIKIVFNHKELWSSDVRTVDSVFGTENGYIDIYEFYVDTSTNIRKIVDNVKLDCALEWRINHREYLHEGISMNLNSIKSFNFETIEFLYKGIKYRIETFKNKGNSFGSPWQLTLNETNWDSYSGKWYLLNGIETDINDTNYFKVNRIKNIQEKWSRLFQNNVNWSYTLEFQDYDRYVFSGVSQLVSIDGIRYIAIPNALGVKSDQQFNNEYFIDVLSGSEYYWAQRVEEIKKTYSDTNKIYTYQVKWNGDDLPVDQEEFLVASINNYEFSFSELNKKSFTFTAEIDLLGEGVSSAKVAVLIYTPLTYIRLKKQKQSEDFVSNATLNDNFDNIDYTITSNLLEGEMNSFRIDKDRELNLSIGFNKVKELTIIEQNPENDINWYQVLLKSKGAHILSDKKYENVINFKHSCDWSSFLDESNSVEVKIITSFKNGILKEVTKNITINMPLYPQVNFGKIQKNSVLLESPPNTIYCFYENSSLEEFRDIFDCSIVNDGDGVYSNSTLGFKCKIDLDASTFTLLDVNNNEVLVINNIEQKKYYKDNITEYYIIKRDKEGAFLFKNNILFKKNFLESIIDFSIQEGSKYEISSSGATYVFNYGQIEDGDSIEVRLMLVGKNVYIHSIQGFYLNSLERQGEINGIYYDIFGDFSAITINNTIRHLSTVTLIPSQGLSFTLNNIDFVPTCLFGTKYNYEENKKNRYEVDPEQIWYFDLDTKANSIDFVNEHTIQPTLSGLPKVGISPTNYMSQTITTKLGYLDEDDMYVGDDGWKLNKFAEWANNGSVKILRLRNGYLIPVDIQLKTNVANHNVVGEPSDITFTWTQIADHKTAVLYGYE